MEAKKNRPGKSPKVRMGRIIHVSRGFQQAREWEILQELSMTPGQRQRVAKALKERFYGKKAPDVREACSRR